MSAKRPTPSLTVHAVQRWRERFPGRDMDEELQRAKPLSKKRLQLLLRQIPVSHRLMVERGGEFLVSSVQSPPAIFVVASDNVVVTTYPLTKQMRHTY